MLGGGAGQVLLLMPLFNGIVHTIIWSAITLPLAQFGVGESFSFPFFVLL